MKPTPLFKVLGVTSERLTRDKAARTLRAWRNAGPVHVYRKFNMRTYRNDNPHDFSTVVIEP